MLVLAMEFSRGAQRAYRAAAIEQTDEGAQQGRASGRQPTKRRAGIASKGSNRPGLLAEQGPRVTPSKRNSDARRHPQSPQAGWTGPPRRCGPPGAGYG
jgi:hypothetical protein